MIETGQSVEVGGKKVELFVDRDNRQTLACADDGRLVAAWTPRCCVHDLFGLLAERTETALAELYRRAFGGQVMAARYTLTAGLVPMQRRDNDPVAMVEWCRSALAFRASSSYLLHSNREDRDLPVVSADHAKRRDDISWAEAERAEAWLRDNVLPPGYSGQWLRKRFRVETLAWFDGQRAADDKARPRLSTIDIDRLNAAANFTRADPCDRDEDGLPQGRNMITVGGVSVFVYIDDDGCVTVSVDYEGDDTMGLDERLPRADGTVPTRINVNGTEVFRA